MKAEFHTTVFQVIPDNLPPSFFILTGWNPNGKEADFGDNSDRDNEIEREIKKLRHFRVTGHSPDEKHAEPGWGFVCSEKRVLEMARKYQQLAIYQVKGDQLTLISADGKKRVNLGKWSERVRDPRNMVHFSIYLGSRSPAARLDTGERHGVIIRVGALFPSFTLLNAEGYFRSSAEDTLVIQVATDKPERVLQVAHELRCFLCQEGVGVLCRGIYQRVRYWTDDRMLLQAWGFPQVSKQP